MPDIDKTIGTDARNYSTITLWEAADGGGDGLGNDDCTGSCYNDSAFDEGVTLNFSANSTVLTVAAGERHDGTAGTGARISTSNLITISALGYTVDVTIDWLEVDCNGKRSDILVNFNNTGATKIANHLLLHDWTGHPIGISLSHWGTVAVALNSIIYNGEETRTWRSFGILDNYTRGDVRNVTIYGMT